MKQYDKIKIEKHLGPEYDLGVFVDFLKSKLPNVPVRLGDSDYYGMHVKCKFAGGECEILEEGKDFELVLYSETASSAENKAAFDKVVTLFKEWLNS